MGRNSKRNRKIASSIPLVRASPGRTLIPPVTTGEGITTFEVADISLKHYDSNRECFSDWRAGKSLQNLTTFINKLQSLTWPQIHSDKGLQLKAHKDDTMKKRLKVSEDVTCFELRVTQKARVHGFRVRNTFYVVWLDVNHQVFPE